MAIPKQERQDIRLLKRKQTRWERRQITVEGEKAILELLKSTWITERIYFTAGRELSGRLRESLQPSTSLAEVSAKDMELMTSLKTPPGLLALATMPDKAGRAEHTAGVWLYLDRMNDPGNVGTLVRVADWFGMAGVVMSTDSSDPFGPKAIQSAMGSAFHTPVRIQNFADLPARWKSRVVGLDAGGQNLFELHDQEAPTMLVVGSESHGVSEDVRSACHVMASIPGAGRAESLNASVAGAIAAASLVQQGVAVGQGR